MAEFDIYGEPIFIDISKTAELFNGTPNAPIVVRTLNTNEEFMGNQNLVKVGSQSQDQNASRSEEIQTEEDCSIIEKECIKNNVIEIECVKTDNQRLRCQECQRYTAVSEDQMIRHIRKVHRGENPFQCYMCNYSTYNKVLFEEHVRIHKGIKPYQCSHCPYKSASKKNTKKHELIHRPENPLRCKSCEFIGRNYRALNKHEQENHSTVKWYKCNICKFKTTLINKLRNHRKMHRYPCKRCDFVGQTRALLKDHSRLDHGVELPTKAKGKIFKCDKCKWTSKCKSRILLHLIHHPNQTVDETFIDISILRKHGIMS